MENILRVMSMKRKYINYKALCKRANLNSNNIMYHLRTERVFTLECLIKIVNAMTIKEKKILGLNICKLYNCHYKELFNEVK